MPHDNLPDKRGEWDTQGEVSLPDQAQEDAIREWVEWHESNPPHVMDSQDATGNVRWLLARLSALKEVYNAVLDYVGPEPLELLQQRKAGNTLIGATADPKWVRVLEALDSVGEKT